MKSWRGALLAIALVAVVTSSLGIIQCCADTSDLTIGVLSYDPVEETVSVAGCSTDEIVNVQLEGDDYCSPISAVYTSNGYYSDKFYVGLLSGGDYVCRVGTASYFVERTLSLDGTVVELNDVKYDPVMEVVSFSGKSTATLVNVRVSGLGFDSSTTAEFVSNGSFSGSLWVGTLGSGQYVCEAGADGIRSLMQFEVKSDLAILGVNFNHDIGIVELTVRSVNGTPTLKVTTPSGGGNECELSGMGDGNYLAKMTFDEVGDFIIDLTCGSDNCSSTYSNKPEGFTFEDDSGHILKSYVGEKGELTIPPYIHTVKSGAFDSCRISRLIVNYDIEWEITINGAYPFEKCGIEELILGSHVTAIPDYLFAKIDIVRLIIPESIRTIGLKSFYACSELESVVFSENSRITEIGDYSFAHNPSLKQVDFGSSEAGFECDIGSGAFLSCGELVKVNVDKGFNLINIGSVAFAKYPQFSYNTGTTDNVQNNSGPLAFNGEKSIVIPSSVESIGDFAFGIVLKSNVSTGGEPGCGIFEGTSTATKQTFNYDGWMIGFAKGSNLRSIGLGAFSGLSGIKSIDLSECDNLSTIGRYAFQNDIDSADNLKLPSGLIEIERDAFTNNTGIGTKTGKVTVPDSIQVLDEAFGNIVDGLIFTEKSNLRKITLYYPGIVTLDLSMCSQLEEIQSSTDTTIITKPGLFIGKGRVEHRGSNSNGVLNLDKDASVLLTSNLSGVRGINLEEGNQYFEYDGAKNQLFFKNGGKKVLVFAGPSDVIELDGVAVWEDAICHQIKTDDLTHYYDYVRVRELRLSNAILSAGALENCENLDSIYILKGSITTYELGSYLGSNDRVITIYFGPECNASDYANFQRLGEVMIGYACGSATVYIPYHDGICSPAAIDGTLVFDASALDGLDVMSSNCESGISNGKLIISPSEFADAYVWFFKNDMKRIRISLDYNGGVDSSGKTTAKIWAIAGQSLSEISIPVPSRSMYRFDGWIAEDGSVIDSDTLLSGDCKIIAKWVERNSMVIVDDDSSRFIRLSSGVQWTGPVEVSHGQKIWLKAMEMPGYQLLNWVVDGRVSHTPITEELEVSCSHGDVHISIAYRYYSTSSGLIPVSDRGMPSADESNDIIYSFDLGGYVDLRGASWTGHASVPLIVDNTVYFRAGTYLYAAESDTGYIFAKVESSSVSSFYHQLGYGSGFIIDYPTGKVYDLDLKQLYVLDHKISGAEYYDWGDGGYFYSSGSSIYRFDPQDEDPTRSDEIKETKLIGKIPNTYGTYGFASSVFVDHYMYRVIVDGNKRGIIAMDLKTGEVNSTYLRGLNYLYLDDGWISYYKGTLYLTGYSSGLFGAIASNDKARVAYVSVDGLRFEEDSAGYYEFGGKGWASQMVFYDDVAYVQASGYLYRFDVVDGKIDVDNVKEVEAALGHGSIVLDVSRTYEDQSVVYIYSIPYRSTGEYGMSITEDRGGVMRTAIVPGMLQYNSQAVRADRDGGMIWYNDSGHIYRYTTPENNRFFFFLNNGDNAVWCESYGRDKLDALLSLDEELIEIDRSYNVKSILGVPVESFSVWELVCEAPLKSVLEDLSEFGWVRVESLFTRMNESSHYIQIVSGSTYTENGAEFKYLGNSEQTYRFKDNIGDRTIVGRILVHGNEMGILRFYDDQKKEIDDCTMIGVVGSKVVGKFPDVSKPGYTAVWKDNEGNVVDSLSDLTYGVDKSCYLDWIKLPGELGITSSWTSEGLRITVDSKDDLDSDLCISVVFRTSDSYETKVEDLSFVGKTANVVLSDVSDSSDALIRILMKVDSGMLSGDYGQMMVSKGVTA